MSDNVVEVSHLSVKFGSFTAVNDISFSVKRGEIFGFLGANGAGKTTTIRVLCGLLVPTAGTALIAGQTFSDETANHIKREVGYMSQKFTLYNDLTVAENLAFTASLRKLPDDEFRKRTQDLFDFIQFKQPVTTLVKNLAGGIKQELSLVAAMLHDPEIIFLDEPTAGVSPAARARFWKLINSLSANGKTIFVTTHYMDEAEECDRIALMRAGEIIALDTPQGLKNSAYPEPLYEIVAPSESQEDWLRAAADLKIGPVQPHGLRYHVTIQNKPGWDEFSARWGGRLELNRIQPSLEDVFIRLVEGKDR